MAEAKDTPGNDASDRDIAAERSWNPAVTEARRSPGPTGPGLRAVIGHRVVSSNPLILGVSSGPTYGLGFWRWSQHLSGTPARSRRGTCLRTSGAFQAHRSGKSRGLAGRQADRSLTSDASQFSISSRSVPEDRAATPPEPSTFLHEAEKILTVADEFGEGPAHVAAWFRASPRDLPRCPHRGHSPTVMSSAELPVSRSHPHRTRMPWRPDEGDRPGPVRLT